MAKFLWLPVYWVVSTLLPLATALPFPIVTRTSPNVAWGSSPYTAEHAASANTTASPSASSDPDSSPSPKEIGIGLGIVGACFLGSFLGLYFFWRRPRNKPQPYHKHVPLSARLRQASSSLVLRVRRCFIRSSPGDNFSLGPTWFPNTHTTRSCQSSSQVDRVVPTWRLSVVSPVSAVMELPTKDVEMIGVAELSSSPMIPYSKSPEMLSSTCIPTFLLPPSPTHVVDFGRPFSREGEPCVSRFSATTVDTTSLRIPASRTSMVTTTSAASVAHGLGVTAGPRGASHALNPYLNSSQTPRASIATFATAVTSTSRASSSLSMSTALVPSAPVVAPAASSSLSRLRLAAEATLIRTPQRAARLVSLRRLRRVRSESVCRDTDDETGHEQQESCQFEHSEQQRQQQEWQWQSTMPQDENQGEAVELEAGEYMSHENRHSDEEGEYRMGEDEQEYGGFGWDRRSQWLGRSSTMSLPEELAGREIR